MFPLKGHAMSNPNLFKRLLGRVWKSTVAEQQPHNESEVKDSSFDQLKDTRDVCGFDTYDPDRSILVSRLKNSIFIWEMRNGAINRRRISSRLTLELDLFARSPKNSISKEELVDMVRKELVD